MVHDDDEDLAVVLGRAVMRLHRRALRTLKGATSRSHTEIAVLDALFKHGTMSVGSLAKHEGVQPPTISRAVRELKEESLVSLASVATDGRLIEVSLTVRGRRVLSRDRTRRDEWMQKHIDSLTADERAAVRRAVPILQRLSDEQRVPTPTD